MFLSFEEFSQASELIDEIMNDSNLDEDNIDSKIRADLENISEANKRDYLNHLNRLFLNILLNRLDEYGDSAKEKCEKAREVVHEIKNEIDV